VAAAVGDHLIHVHIELRATARHPNVQRKRVVVLAGEDFVTHLNDQFVFPIIESLAAWFAMAAAFFKMA
jgi:hypothetical protein